MLQSQILSVLPRRMLASLWASAETRLTLSHFTANNHSNATSPAFLCAELPVRYMHMLRLLSSLPLDALQSPMIKHVSHRYLHDLCTLLHPSMQNTSSRAFSDVMRRLRQRQATSLIRLRYALAGSAMLMDNINTIGLGIQFLTEQHLSWPDRVQEVRPVEIAMQAADDVRQVCASCLGKQPPSISITDKGSSQEMHYAPSALHRILFESMLLAVRAHMTTAATTTSTSRWPSLSFMRKNKQRPIQLDIFGGPTSVGFRLDSPAPLLTRDTLHDIPRDPIGIPIAHQVLSSTEADTLSKHGDEQLPNAEWHVWSGWRAAKTMASHWGGNLDAMSVDGLGTTMYLALDRDLNISERYPVYNPSRRRYNPETQLEAFLDAISQQQSTTHQYQRPAKDHSISLSAAVASAVAHA
ncbi:hypothetical protein RO3G_05312 [Lichtheimia corymbifera JMRC:FSU:9682]|uniref:Protein-serine/threonine kinase n=1 Tax=Lichtheimia corymbifera JMRC:FSU:9682 TaxID=1263082 RepID=A0A068RQJ4_9FUNG|nr:hypothetical protein RO3G_05312 [Lichtheimia corymbifera JMRC:FSU:9682]